jgi:hypothetical protein
MRSEREGGGNISNIVEILALIRAQKLNKDDMGANERAIVEFYTGLIDEDPNFAKRVTSRYNQLSQSGVKTQLFPLEIINKLKKRKRKKKEKLLQQSPLWPSETTENNKLQTFDSKAHSEGNLSDLMRRADSRRYSNFDNDVRAEVSRNKDILRKKIGLPIARGNSPYVNDPFYEFLVNKVCNEDRFGIFTEHDRSYGEITPELDAKIKDVGGIIDELINGNHNRRFKFKTFKEFTQQFEDKWNQTE